MTDFIHPERDRAISFVTDAEGQVRFHVLTRFEPLEFEGLQPVYWRKVHRSDPYPSKAAAFDAARELFAWVDAGWRAELGA